MTNHQRLMTASALAILGACTTAAPVVSPVDEASAKRTDRCGVDIAAIDQTVSPRVDFYGYATGGWTTEEGTVADALEEAARATLSAAGGRTEEFVQAYVERDPRDATGTKPVLDAARDLLAERDRRALAAAAAKAALRQGTTPFRVGAYPDPDDPGTTSLILAAGGAPLGAPEDYDRVGETYKERIATTLSLLGVERPERLAGRVFDFERALADAYAADARQTYTERQIRDLARLRGGDPWAAYFAALGVDADEVKMREIGALSLAATAWRNAGRDTLAAYLAFHRVSDVADFLPPEYGGKRDAMTARAIGERIFEAEEGALLRGLIGPETRAVAEEVGKAMLGPGTNVVVAGGPQAYAVPDEAGRATAAGVERAAQARGASRIAQAGGDTQVRSRLAADLTAVPNYDEATRTLDLPAGLLRGPVYGTSDEAAAYGALGGLILRQRGFDAGEAMTRAYQAYAMSQAGATRPRCGLRAAERFMVGYAQGAYGADRAAINAAVAELPAFDSVYGLDGSKDYGPRDD